MLWSKVHSHRLLRACLLGSKRKLPPPACQVRLGHPSAVCRPRGVQLPGTMYICNQGPLSSASAHCISCAPSACSRCRMVLLPTPVRQTAHVNSPELCRRSRPVPHDLRLSSIYSQSFLLHCFFLSQEPPDTFLE